MYSLDDLIQNLKAQISELRKTLISKQKYFTINLCLFEEVESNHCLIDEDRITYSTPTGDETTLYFNKIYFEQSTNKKFADLSVEFIEPFLESQKKNICMFTHGMTGNLIEKF